MAKKQIPVSESRDGKRRAHERTIEVGDAASSMAADTDGAAAADPFGDLEAMKADLLREVELLRQNPPSFNPDGPLNPGHVQAMAAEYRAMPVEDAVAQAETLSEIGKLVHERESLLVDVPGRTRTENGHAYRNADGKRHREDGPAVILDDGAQVWWRDGKRHRDDGPAVIAANGMQQWHRNGEQHREDGPAYIGADGTQAWWRDGELHREDGPAYIGADGAQKWSRDGYWHRDDGPAIIDADGTQRWYRDGNLQREVKVEN